MIKTYKMFFLCNILCLLSITSHNLHSSYTTDVNLRIATASTPTDTAEEPWEARLSDCSSEDAATLYNCRAHHEETISSSIHMQKLHQLKASFAAHVEHNYTGSPKEKSAIIALIEDAMISITSLQYKEGFTIDSAGFVHSSASRAFGDPIHDEEQEIISVIAHNILAIFSNPWTINTSLEETIQLAKIAKHITIEIFAKTHNAIFADAISLKIVKVLIECPHTPLAETLVHAQKIANDAIAIFQSVSRAAESQNDGPHTQDTLYPIVPRLKD